MIESKIICDSIGAHSPRLVTMLCKYPKFVHSEHLRHRSFSFSVSTSRAIPVAKNLEEVRSDDLRAAPVWWGREQKGMSSGEELDEGRLYWAKECWRMAALEAANMAEGLVDYDVHKSIVNRVLEPFLHVNVLVTGTHDGWMNFFGLRLDKAAQPEIRALAEAQWECWNEHEPTKLDQHGWHLPFIDFETWDQLWPNTPDILDEKADAIKISVARCARLSYMSFETGKRSIIEEDLKLYDRLVGSSPIHASPAEHQATPDSRIQLPEMSYDTKSKELTVTGYTEGKWIHSEQNGNLGPGWRQYRKMLPNESIAPLPEGYRI